MKVERGGQERLWGIGVQGRGGVTWMESNFCQRDADKRLTTREVAESMEEQGSREGRRGRSACEGNVGLRAFIPWGSKR